MSTVLNNIKVELKSIPSMPNLIAEIWQTADLGDFGKSSVCIATLVKSDNFDLNPDGFWMPCISQVSKKGRYPKVRLNDTLSKQITGELKDAIIELVKETKETVKEQKSTAHTWC